MSMGLFGQSGVYQESWVEMRADVTMSYEVDRDNKIATLTFGSRNEYSLAIGLRNLEQLLELASAARLDLVAHAEREPVLER